MTADERHNKRLELLATWLNNIAVAFVVVGFIGPAVNGQTAGATGVAWILVGAGLHYLARSILGGLR